MLARLTCKARSPEQVARNTEVRAQHGDPSTQKAQTQKAQTQKAQTQKAQTPRSTVQCSEINTAIH